jgi:hypothetical protein
MQAIAKSSLSLGCDKVSVNTFPASEREGLWSTVEMKHTGCISIESESHFLFGE